MRIGQLADAAGVTTKTLRYYESESLLREPDRTPSGYRDYPADTVDRVAFSDCVRFHVPGLVQFGEQHPVAQWVAADVHRYAVTPSRFPQGAAL